MRAVLFWLSLTCFLGLGLTTTTLLHNCTLIDGTGAAPRLASITFDRTILAVDSVHEAKSGRSYDRFEDCAGRVLTPGLIDTHVHVSSEDQNYTAVSQELARALLGGVTHARDMGGDDIFLRPLTQVAKNPDTASPRMLYGALVGGPAFFEDPRMAYCSHGFLHAHVPWLRHFSSDDIFEPVVHKVAEQTRSVGESAVKIYGDLNASMVTAVASAAHHAGLRVWGHSAVFPSKPSENVRAGMDVMSHSAYLVWEAVRPMPDSYTVRKQGPYDEVPFDADNITALLHMMRDYDRILDATVWVFSQEIAGKESDGVSPLAYPWACNVTAHAHRLGVTVTTGTDDMMPDPSESVVPNVHHEIESLVSCAGFTPLEAITAATLNGAKALDIAHTHGTIEPGKAADFLLLRANADPIANIRALRDIATVYKDGTPFDTSDYDAIVAHAGILPESQSGASYPPQMPQQYSAEIVVVQADGLPEVKALKWYDAQRQAVRMDNWLANGTTTVWDYKMGSEFHLDRRTGRCNQTSIFQGAIPAAFPWVAYPGAATFMGTRRGMRHWSVADLGGGTIDVYTTTPDDNGDSFPVKMVLNAGDAVLQTVTWHNFSKAVPPAHVFEQPCQPQSKEAK